MVQLPKAYFATLCLAHFAILTTPGFAQQARSQPDSSCLSDSASIAHADSLALKAYLDGEDPGMPAGLKAVHRELRQVVEAAPLTDSRWQVVYQMTRFLNAPDTAMALATTAARKWPRCVSSQRALSDAKRFAAERRDGRKEPPE